MIKVLVLLIGLTLAGVAQAQIKCWTDAKGKRSCGDVPPPGVKVETPKGAPATADTKQATPAPAPQDEANRRRPGESQTAAAKAYLAKQGKNNVNMRECERAREMLRAMGGGGRSQRTDAAKARALANDNCP